MNKFLLSAVIASTLITSTIVARSQPLTNVSVSSTDNLDVNALHEVITPFLGKEIDVPLLQDLLNEISYFYQNQGYLAAQAFFPEQESSDGQLQVIVSAANLGEVHINNQSKTDDGVMYTLLDGVLKEQGRVIDTNELNVNLLKARDLNVFDISGHFEQVGADEIDLTLDINDKTPYAYDVFYDNYGTKGSGKHRFVGVFNAINLWSLADKTSCYASTTNEGQNNIGVDFNLPVNSNLDVVGASLAYGDYDLADEYDELDANGKLFEFNAYYISPVFYDLNHSLKLGVSPYFKYMQDNIDAFEIKMKRKSYGLATTLYHGYNTDAVSMKSSFTANAGVFTSDDEYMLYDNEKYFFLRTDNQIIYRINDDFSLINQLQVQFTNNSLDPSDKFVFGGAYAVKAYQSNLASSDLGIFDDLKLLMRVNTYSNVYTNFMQAHGKNIDSKADSVYAVGLGGSATFGGFYLDCSVNAAIGKNKEFSEDDAKFLIKFGYSNI